MPSYEKGCKTNFQRWRFRYWQRWVMFVVWVQKKLNFWFKLGRFKNLELKRCCICGVCYPIGDMKHEWRMLSLAWRCNEFYWSAPFYLLHRELMYVSVLPWSRTYSSFWKWFAFLFDFKNFHNLCERLCHWNMTKAQISTYLYQTFSSLLVKILFIQVILHFVK